MKIHRLSILNNNEKGRKSISSNDRNKGNKNSRKNQKLKGKVTAKCQAEHGSTDAILTGHWKASTSAWHRDSVQFP